MESFSYLKKVHVFKDLSEDDLKKVSKIVTEKAFPKNSFIFMEGYPGNAFYYVISGMVKVSRNYEDGREHIIHIFGPGEVFGEATIFNDVQYPASATAYQDTLVGMIQNKDIEKIIVENPEIGLKIIKIMSSKLLLAQQKIKDLTFNDVFSRVGSQLIKLANEHGKKSDKGIVLDMDLSRQELADMVGSTRETVSRVISKFKKEKCLTEIKDTIIIDIKKLEEWLYNYS